MEVPVVIEPGRNERPVDIYSRLLQDRVVFLLGVVDDHSANSLVAQMFYLQAIDPKADIHFFINSPGGSVTAGMGLYDTMQFLSCDVNTYCMGMAASMGALLLTSGTKGKRFAMPHASIMIHQPSLGGFQGTSTDIEIRTKELLRTKKLLNEVLLRHTGQTLDKVEKDTDRDKFLSPYDAKEYGLIDHVLESFPKNIGRMSVV